METRFLVADFFPLSSEENVGTGAGMCVGE